jgi:hypothetical protein
VKKSTFLFLFLLAFGATAQLNPAITNWLINTDGTTGRHYVQGNPTPIIDADFANILPWPSLM